MPDGQPILQDMRLVAVLSTIVVLICIASVESAETETAGTARVIDGDTIEVSGQRIRLHGIDAPEHKQMSQRDGEEWDCGRQATIALHEKIGKKPVRCEERDRDHYGRIVAGCFFRDTDINEWLVLQGWAVAYVRYSRDYMPAEATAKSERRGIWAGEFEKPWEWRR